MPLSSIFSHKGQRFPLICAVTSTPPRGAACGHLARYDDFHLSNEQDGWEKNTHVKRAIHFHCTTGNETVKRRTQE
ncbi:hypothetical protein [uncultured Roseovarius sp.]|uniref:hypothetical protein n=1 Tax=Roseovarius sp. TaxID=1486281 RepID=UPI0025E2C8F2|nr:hypothetical protein [uncultured Roseovarius sp.]